MKYWIKYVDGTEAVFDEKEADIKFSSAWPHLVADWGIIDAADKEREKD